MNKVLDGLRVAFAMILIVSAMVGAAAFIIWWAESEDFTTWDKADNEGNCYIRTVDVNTFGPWSDDPEPVITTYCRED